MKKKILIPCIAVLLFLAVLFVPIYSGAYKDGGTRDYKALTYRVIKWRRFLSEENLIYEKNRVYFLPDNFKSIDELWQEETDNIEHKITATVTAVIDDYIYITSLDDSSEKLSFCCDGLKDIGVKKDDKVEVTYRGEIEETYPCKINAVDWQKCNDLSQIEYHGRWIDRGYAVSDSDTVEGDYIISRIYADCFFGIPVNAVPRECIKINGKLSEKWCLYDTVHVTFENYIRTEDSTREEADLLTVEESSVELDPDRNYKPVIYLYPQETTEVSVKLDTDGRLTCTYPAYNNGWNVTAYPDGTLKDESGQNYNYLYWEGETYANYDMQKGFCIKGEDTAAFLEDALAKLGLNRREANEFIVYWLPQMQDNPYNIISFQTDAYTDAAKLDVTPSPDTLIRVFMAWQASDSYVELEKQPLSAPERSGFTVIEWGGTEVGKDKY